MVRSVAEGVLARVTDTVTPQPVAAIGRFADVSPGTAASAAGPLALVLVGVGDPGNAGTLLRSAEAAGGGAVLFCDGSVDPYGPKCVRASAGSVFRVAVTRSGDAGEVLACLASAGLGTLATVARGARPYDEVDLAGPVALVLGSEAHGLPGDVAARVEQAVTIPMVGRTESLNVGHGGHDPLLRVPAPAPPARPGLGPGQPTGRDAAVGGRVHRTMTGDPTGDVTREIQHIEDEARVRVNAATTADELRTVEVEVLGRRSALAGLRQRLGELEPDQRRTVGQVLNGAMQALGAAVEERRAVLAAAERTERLLAERMDLTEVWPGRPAGHLHLVTQAIQELEDVFVGMGFTVAEGPEVETDWNNFGALNFPEDHPARDMYDTLYVNYGEPGSTLLRTHTSPVQVRVMTGTPPPYYTVMPGRVFRSDTADATHMPVFHQIEGLVVDRDITFADLAGTIDAFTKAYFGGDFTSRLRPSYFPFTEPSAEFDIQRPDGTWLELGGCGMVHPNVLRNCGLDPDEWQGFAFGFGIDRLAAARHGVDDLRDLFTNDIRFLTQF